METFDSLKESSLKEFPLFCRGKVRDVYDLGERLLIVSTDRISAFDFILPTAIPGKGKILNGISAFWFRKLSSMVPNHLISTDFADFPRELRPHRSQLEGRSMLVKRLKRIDIECVVRGYLAGSGWKQYKEKGTVCGIKLPSGLKQSEKLPEPIFTPSTKAAEGSHDENISYDTMSSFVGEEKSSVLKEISVSLYREAGEYARRRGIIIADTKFEFGEENGKICLIDEALTPDSSRFWEESRYRVGTSPESYDKQFVRDYLEKISWNKQPPVPPLPEDIVRKTLAKYSQALERLTQTEKK